VYSFLLLLLLLLLPSLISFAEAAANLNWHTNGIPSRGGGLSFLPMTTTTNSDAAQHSSIFLAHHHPAARDSQAATFRYQLEQLTVIYQSEMFFHLSLSLIHIHFHVVVKLGKPGTCSNFDLRTHFCWLRESSRKSNISIFLLTPSSDLNIN